MCASHNSAQNASGPCARLTSVSMPLSIREWDNWYRESDMVCCRWGVEVFRKKKKGSTKSPALA